MAAAEESADFLRPNGGNHVVHKMPSSSTIGLEDEEDLTWVMSTDGRTLCTDIKPVSTHQKMK